MANSQDLPLKAALPLLVCGIFVVVGGTIVGLNAGSWVIPFAWLSGAGVFGFLTGYITGASEQVGREEFLKFLGTGILVPLAAASATLLPRAQRTEESYEYVGTQVAKKITEITYSSEVASWHPIAMFGEFLAFFGFFAVLGIMLGSGLRIRGQANIATRLR